MRISSYISLSWNEAPQKRRRMKFSGVCSMCACCPLLLVLLWPQLAAGFVLGYNDMLRSTENLLEALHKVQAEINKTDALWHLLPANCSGGGATLSQPTTVLQNLSRLCCLQQLQVTWPHFKHDQSHLIKLSRDLLQHMSSEDPVSCSTLPPPSLDYDNVRRLVKCVSCWIYQVELVNSTLANRAQSKTLPKTL